MRKKLAAIMVAVWLLPMLALAQLTGTNAVSIVEANLDNAATTAWPWAVGFLGISIAVSVFLFLWKKGKARA